MMDEFRQLCLILVIVMCVGSAMLCSCFFNGVTLIVASIGLSLILLPFLFTFVGIAKLLFRQWQCVKKRSKSHG